MHTIQDALKVWTNNLHDEDEPRERGRDFGINLLIAAEDRKDAEIWVVYGDLLWLGQEMKNSIMKIEAGGFSRKEKYTAFRAYWEVKYFLDGAVAEVLEQSEALVLFDLAAV
jgi:hypothetical protein